MENKWIIRADLADGIQYLQSYCQTLIFKKDIKTARRFKTKAEANIVIKKYSCGTAVKI
jgi:hypothetical protein